MFFFGALIKTAWKKVGVLVDNGTACSLSSFCLNFGIVESDESGVGSEPICQAADALPSCWQGMKGKPSK